jgi:hypothetical protein
MMNHCIRNFSLTNKSQFNFRLPKETAALFDRLSLHIVAQEGRVLSRSVILEKILTIAAKAEGLENA